MLIMKRILLPTDFSEISINAIHYAVQLFKDVPCEFFLMNVFRVPYVANEEFMENDLSQLAVLEGELYDASIKRIKDLIKKMPKNKGHKFNAISDYNLFGNAIQAKIKENKIELIVMGTKGATGAKEVFMGSNTGDVILRTTCNVIAVPENNHFKPPKEIVFPTDFRINYDFADLAPLISLAEMYDSVIRILHLSDKQELDEEQNENKRTLASFFINIEHTFHVLSNTDFEEALNCFTQSRGDIDMIAIVARHYTFFQRLFFRPKVQELSFHTKIPLFVLHLLNE
jgi:nucleotide-binding universal stress UspA family protein